MSKPGEPSTIEPLTREPAGRGEVFSGSDTGLDAPWLSGALAFAVGLLLLVAVSAPGLSLWRPGEAAGDPAARAPSPAQAARLESEAQERRYAGDLRGTLELAAAAIEADPEDAGHYLFLADTLQEQGQRPEAKRVLRLCSRRASRGDVERCRSFRR